MAHVGTKYPLAFRRDLGFGLDTNQNSWAKAYWVSTLNCSGTIPPTLVKMALVVVEFDPGENYAVWQSKVTRLAGRDLVARMIIDNSTRLPGQFEARWELDDSVRGNIGIGVLFPKVDHVYRELNGGAAFGVHPSPDLFNPGGQNNVLHHALTWEEFHSL